MHTKLNRLRLGYNILRYLGPRIVWLRARVYLRRRLGFDRQIYPYRGWGDIRLENVLRNDVPAEPSHYAAWKLENLPRFLFQFGDPPPFQCDKATAGTRTPSLSMRTKLLEDDRCIYFLNQVSPEPIDWFQNPWDGLRTDGTLPWYEIPDYLPHQGDPRTLWEPGRAAWAIDCAKLYAAGDQQEATKLYWRWLDSWMRSSPPYHGFHWKCGQESAVRLIAVLLGFWAVGRNEGTHEDRFSLMAQLAWATGYRVFHHISYALSQKNNHALSEACGLMLVGQLFPEFAQAENWKRRGREVLFTELDRQIYDDGSYVQHSTNYHRVMLQDATLGLRLAELDDHPFPRRTYDRVGRAADFLFAMTDDETGQVPLYGNNDGAYVLPLSECDFLDYRPAIQSAHYLVHRERLLPEGPWDEDLAWLFGVDALDHEPPRHSSRSSSAFDVGGYYTLRRDSSWAMIRAHTYVDRPGHCDPLHVDLWWKGQNVLRDCGNVSVLLPQATRCRILL